uniref:NADH-ubiquinone oxidoreductase chain 2 n=1 Tax=Anaspis sp. ANA01 TaxID=1205535 RepID=A0A0S2MSH6_9CUCU|nr:NADH deshydrogenase subunit 2 [Anaspis sp. ANA01]
MMKLYKIMFFSMMVMGTLISISAYSWMSMWMGLEINLLSIIPLISSTKNMYSTESAMKYFITQALASMILLFTVILMLSLTEFINPQMNSSMMMMLNSALLTKLGAAPFHYWFPEVMEGLNWMNSLILLTWQKIAPFILLMNNELNYKFMFTIIICCLIVSTFMSFNQVSLRKIMTFSSINHVGWMISSILMSKTIWVIYFIIYSFITLNLISLFNKFKCYYLSQILTLMNNNKTLKINFMMNFMSLGGLPPFIGFFPKWLNINWLIMNNNFVLTTALIMMTLIMLYIYIRSMFTSIVIMHHEYKINNFNFKINSFLMNFVSLTTLIFCTMMFNYY